MFKCNFSNYKNDFSLVKKEREPFAKIVNSVIDNKQNKKNSQNYFPKTSKNEDICVSSEIFEDEDIFDNINLVNDNFYHVEMLIGDKKNSQDVTDYENIIYREMRKKELLFPLCQATTLITASQRGFIVDWMAKVHFDTQLSTNTLHRAVGILDRSINCITIEPSELIYFAAASLLIASKVENGYALKLKKIANVSLEKLEESKILEKEILITNAINFDLEFPTPLFFLNYLLRINGQTTESMLFARFVIEVCFTSPSFIDVKPSALASIAVIIMRIVYGESPWSKDLQDFTQFSLNDLKEDLKCAYEVVIDYKSRESRFIRHKYGSELFMEVSQFEIPDEVKNII